MGTITIKPGDLRKNSPKGEHITRIMYDDNEPPKNYIWGKPDGYLYQWNGKKWIPLNEVPNMCPPYDTFPSFPHNNQYISKSELDSRLKTLKTEIVAYLNKVVSMRNCSGSGGDAAIEWVNENIVPDLNILKDIDHNAFATKEELSEAINDVASSQAIVEINSDIDALDARLDSLESIDLSMFVTAQDLPTPQ